MIHLICPNPAVDRTLLVKEFSKSSPNRPTKVREYPGGKSFNVAYAIKKEKKDLDVKVHTILGGEFGKYVEKLADERGISLKKTWVNKNTRICNIIVDTENNLTYPIYERGFELTDVILKKFTKKLIESVNENDDIVFSGSFMKGFPDNYISQLKGELANKNVKIFVDTSGDNLIDAYKSNPFLIKINDEEILDLFNDFAPEGIRDYIDLLKDKVDINIPYFIVTLGDKGAVARLNNKFYHLSVPSVEVKNPVASGDFYLGALISFINSSNSSDLDTSKKAISYSTANCLNWFPEFSLEDSKHFYKQIKITEFE